MWTRGEEGALAAYPPPEIAAADLAGLALDLAQWGARADELAFLTPPPPVALAEARTLLRDLGALDARDRITDHGRALAALPVHPRLGHLLAIAGRQGARLAALLEEPDPMRGAGTDLDLRLRTVWGDADGVDRATCTRLRGAAKRLERRLPATHTPLGTGEMAALAYPDRIGLRRPGDAPRYLLSGGKGAILPPDDPLAGQRLIVATDLDGDPREARIRRAAPVSESALRAVFADRIREVHVCFWSERDRKVVARVQERLGAIALSDRIWKDVPPERVAQAALDGVRALGLGAIGGQADFARLRARIAAACPACPDLPDPSEAALLATADRWLLPFLFGVRDADGLARVDAAAALDAALDHAARRRLDRAAPANYTTPLGRDIPIDYAGEAPEIAVRLQEMFGETRHPEIAGAPLRVTLLSPAGRPVQTTMDLPGFWAGSYAEVRKEMRARYPKHSWPEDPQIAAPTLRAGRRG